jgi:hypothetical protein
MNCEICKHHGKCEFLKKQNERRQFFEKAVVDLASMTQTFKITKNGAVCPYFERAEKEKGVYCYDCKNFFVDEKDVCRCKLKMDGYTGVDPDIQEPCTGFEDREGI